MKFNKVKLLNKFIVLLMVFAVFIFIKNKHSVVNINDITFTAETAINNARIENKEIKVDIDKTPPGQIADMDRLLKILDPKDSKSIFKIIDIIGRDKNFNLNCHEVAHDIGHKAYELYGFSNSVNFTDESRIGHDSVQDICAGGYIHGVLEEAFVSDEGFVKNINNACNDVNNKIKDSCRHGVGHALMYVYNRDYRRSMLGCANFETKNGKSRCYEGVWMELFWGVSIASSTVLEFDTEYPMQICKDTNQDAKASCFLYSSFGYLRKHKRDYIGVIKLCVDSNLKEDDTNFCVKGVGITMNSHFKGQSLERSEVYAKNIKNINKKAYYQGVFGFAKLTGIDFENLKSSCEKFKNDREFCLDAINSI